MVILKCSMFIQCRLFFVCFLLCVVPDFIAAANCFKDLFIFGEDIDSNGFNQTISACIDPTIFPGRIVKKLYIQEQTIGDIGPDSVKDMPELETISFWKCKIPLISPGMFRNVPKLKHVSLTYGNLKEIPRNVFNIIPTMEILELFSNEIDIVEDQAFANLFSLKQVHAYANKLEYWNREWFTNSTELEVMDFTLNKVRTIPRRAFASLTKLKEIYFDYNEISVIHADAFRGITHLDYLGLSNNRLTEIKEDIFPNELKLVTFLIHANYLNFLSENMLRKVSVKDIKIVGNPWKCPCLDRILFWIYTNNATMRRACTEGNVPVCAYSKTYSQTCLEYKDSELTNRYITYLKSLEISDVCARLD